MIKPAITAVIGLALCSFVRAEPVKCAGFEKGDKTAARVIKNASAEVVTAGADEIIPEGERYFSVTLAPGTFLAVTLPTSAIPAKAATITMWLKGSPENKSKPVLSMDEWGWKGRSWEGNAMIDLSEAEWVRYEFKAADFIRRSSKDAKASGPMRINEHQRLVIGLPDRKGYESVKFAIDDIEIE